MADYNSSYTGPQIDNAVAAGLAVRGVDGIVKSDGNGNISAAVANVDYVTSLTSSASGNIAHFTDGADSVPLKSLMVDINPVQAGSGDPSLTNIRPISGWAGTSVYHAGDFAIQFSALEQGTLSGVTGATSSSTTRVRSGFVAISAGTYKLFIASGYLVSYRFYTTEDYTTYSRDDSDITLQGGNINFTVPAGYIRIVIGKSDDAALAPTDIDLRKVVVCKAAVVEHNVSWQTAAGTVYGGSFNVITGELTVDKIGLVFTGASDESWVGSGSGDYYFVRYVYSGKTTGASSDRACSHFPNASVVTTSTDTGYYAYTSSGTSSVYLNFRPDSSVWGGGSKTIANWKAWLAAQYANNTPVTCWFSIKEPSTYQLTPTEVTTLLGENNIWADCGDVAVEYRRSCALLEDVQAMIDATVLGAMGGSY